MPTQTQYRAANRKARIASGWIDVALRQIDEALTWTDLTETQRRGFTEAANHLEKADQVLLEAHS